MKQVKVFIAQPMYGLSDEEIINKRKEIMLRMPRYYKSKVSHSEEDFEFIEIDTMHHDLPEGSPRLYYLGESIKLLNDADIVVFCEGWKEAKGCQVEMTVCNVYGKPYFFECELYEFEHLEE